MRRVSLYYGLTVLAMMFAVWACRRVGLDVDQGKPEPKITVEEARAFFENQVLATKAGTGFGGRHDHPVGFSPGDFTPMWDRAVRAAANQWVEGVDLPIDPTFLFTASFPRVGRDGDTVYRTVDVVQKLVVNRWHDHPRWDGMYAYVATIIPTPEYYARHKNFGRKFVILGDKGEFSGWMIAHNMQGHMVSMARYVDGMKTQYWYDGDGSGIPAAAVKQMLDGGTVYSGTRAMYNVHVEAPDVFAYACQRCKMQDCHCKAGGGGCFCTIKDDTEETDPTPPKPPTPPIDGSGGDGGGGSSGGNQGNQDGDVSPKELMNPAFFVGYLVSGDCMQGCIQILAKYGIRTPYTSIITLATQGLNQQLNILAAEYYDGVNAINRHINAGRPIIVGVSRGWSIDAGNYNGATDHFVVVTGRGFDADANLYYFTYMETGVSDASGYNTDTNRLYIDVSVPDLVDYSPLVGKEPYHVTEVRVNDGK